jgi:hypothetical protein
MTCLSLSFINMTRLQLVYVDVTFLPLWKYWFNLRQIIVCWPVYTFSLIALICVLMLSAFPNYILLLTCLFPCWYDQPCISMKCWYWPVSRIEMPESAWLAWWISDGYTWELPPAPLPYCSNSKQDFLSSVTRGQCCQLWTFGHDCKRKKLGHCKKSVLKIQEYIQEGANLKFYIPEFFNFKLLIPEYSPIQYTGFGFKLQNTFLQCRYLAEAFFLLI